MARSACCWPHDARHVPRHGCSPLFRAPPPPLSCSVAFGVAPFVLASGLPGFWWVCSVVGLGGGLADAGSGPPPPWEFPLGGADACTPRQGVTLLYGPSICTRFVQMDLRRIQVHRPFPTPGSGTLWVAGESLRDRLVSCLPRWTVCPTRSPSQDTNRSTCRGERSWSGPLATPQGRCHLGPPANGPGRNPPYCVRSGGADTVTGGAPKLLRSGPSPASPSGSCRPDPPRPPCWPLPPRFLSWGYPLPALLSALPGSCRALPAPCFLSPLWHFVCQFQGRVQAAWRPHRLPPVSPSGIMVCPASPPISPCRLLAVLIPFLGGWG